MVRHWYEGEETGRQAMGASRRMEQLKYSYWGTERKESELNPSFPVLCACGISVCFWSVYLRWVIWLTGMLEVHPVPAVCTPPTLWGSTPGTCSGVSSASSCSADTCGHTGPQMSTHSGIRCGRPRCTSTHHCTVCKDQVREHILRFELVG